MLCVSHETHDDRKEKAEKLYLEFIIAQAIFICFLVGCAGQHVRGDDERDKRKEKYIFEVRLQTGPQRNAYIISWCGKNQVSKKMWAAKNATGIKCIVSFDEWGMIATFPLVGMTNFDGCGKELHHPHAWSMSRRDGGSHQTIKIPSSILDWEQEEKTTWCVV